MPADGQSPSTSTQSSTVTVESLSSSLDSGLESDGLELHMDTVESNESLLSFLAEVADLEAKQEPIEYVATQNSAAYGWQYEQGQPPGVPDSAMEGYIGGVSHTEYLANGGGPTSPQQWEQYTTLQGSLFTFVYCQNLMSHSHCGKADSLWTSCNFLPLRCVMQKYM